MEYQTFVQGWEAGALNVRVDRSMALQIANSDRLPKRYRYAHIFWSWVWMLTLPGSIVAGIWYSWWAGLLLFLVLFPGLFFATRKSACQFMIDHALEDREFFNFAWENGVIEIKPDDASEGTADDEMDAEEAEALTQAYAEVLEKSAGNQPMPISQLPASIDKLKMALFMSALFRIRGGQDADAVYEAHQSAYGKLAVFATPEEMERDKSTTMKAAKKIARSTDQSTQPAQVLEHLVEAKGDQWNEIKNKRAALEEEFAEKFEVAVKIAEAQRTGDIALASD